MKQALFFALAFALVSLPSAQAQLTSNLVACWRFDEGSGTTALDASGNKHYRGVI
jgi:hypothetical protein